MRNQSKLTNILSGLTFIFSANLMASSIPDTVIQAYKQGMRGDKEQNQLAINSLKKINSTSPNPIVLAMLGSAETTQARYTDQPWEKMKFAEQGLAKLGKAIKQAEPLPYSLSSRVNITAGCTFVQVPKMMNRAEHGNHLLHKVIDKQDEFKSLPTELKASAYRCASIAAQKLEDAQSEQHYKTLSQRLSAATRKTEG